MNAFFVANEHLCGLGSAGCISTDAGSVDALVHVHHRRPNFFNRGWAYPENKTAVWHELKVSTWD